MSRYAELDSAYINPSAVTHISYTDKDATVHFIGGGSFVVTKDEAEKIASEMEEHDRQLGCIAEVMEHNLMGRLDDIIKELHRIFGDL